MFLRQLCKLTSIVEGLLSQAHRNHAPCFYHDDHVKVSDENNAVPYEDQQSLSLDSMSAEEIISTLEAKKNLIKGSHMVMTLNTISNHYKGFPRTVEEEHLIRKCIPFFIQNKNKLSGQQALDIVKMLYPLGVSKKSKIYSAMLQHILHHINELSLKNFCELSDIILDETIDPSLRSKLQAALGERLIVKLSMDFEENDSEFYRYAFHLICQIPQLPVKSNLTQILMKKLSNYGDVLPLDVAVLIYKSLHSLRYSKLKVYILQKVQNDLAKQAHLFDWNQIKEMISLLVEQEKHDQYGDCYNDIFVNALVKRVIDGKCNVRLALWLLVKIGRLQHKSVELLDYCCIQIFGGRLPTHLKEKLKWALITEISLARHKTIFWDEIQNSVPKLASEFCKTPQDFVILVYELISLDCFINPIIEKAFDGSFRPSVLSTESRIFCKIYQILKLNPSYDGPMPTDSQIADLRLFLQKNHFIRKSRPFPLLIHLEERIKDPACIQIDVKTQYFHELEYVVGFYQDGTPAPISVNPPNNQAPDGFRYIEDFSVPPGAKLVIVQLLPSYWCFRNTHELTGKHYPYMAAMENLPYPVAFINRYTWKKLPDDEKTSFIMDTIKSKLESAF